MIRPFRFWCNKILPLVYDDSLSYYELLAKVVDYLNKVIDTTNANTDYISTLAGMITSFIESPELKEIIEAKLDEMAEDGTLDAIVNQPKMFVPNDESIDDYKTGTLKCIASWLYYLQGSKCKELNAGEAESPNCYRAIYNSTGKSWVGLLGADSLYPHPDFIYTDRVNGVPVVYSCCSSFVGMLTRDRGYLESPNFLALSGAATTEAEMRNTCLELGNAFQYSWTFDFLNWMHTPHMMYVMEKSGCTPRIFNLNGEYDSKVFDNMETGDIIFCSRNDNNYYKKIHHVMYYIKNLADLNNCGHDYPCTFKAYDFSDIDDYPDSGEHGYIVHCTWGITDGVPVELSPNDCIRIETLEHAIAYHNRSANKTPFKFYVCKPYSNALNSSKARRVVTNTINDHNSLMFGYRLSASFPQTNKFNSDENKWYQHDVAIEGSYVGSGETQEVVDLDEFVGVVSWPSTAITAGKILNAPSGGHSGTVISYGVKGTRGAQIAILGVTNEICWRKKTVGGTWTEWSRYTPQLSNPVEET